MKIGMHMLELRRVRAGIFSEEDKNYPSVNLYDLEKAVEEFKNGNEEFLRKILIPGEIISELHEAVEIKSNSVKQTLTGKPIYYKDLKNEIRMQKDEIICVFSDEIFIGVYKVVNENEIFAKADFVLQDVNN